MTFTSTDLYFFFFFCCIGTFPGFFIFFFFFPTVGDLAGFRNYRAFFFFSPFSLCGSPFSLCGSQKKINKIKCSIKYYLKFDYYIKIIWNRGEYNWIIEHLGYLLFLSLLYSHAILSSITTTYTNANIGRNRQTLLFRHEQLINFWVQFFDTRRETILKSLFIINTMLTTPPMFGTSLVGDPKNLTAATIIENSTQFSAPMAETQFSACMVQSQIVNCMVGPQLLNTMVGPQLLNTMVGPQLNLFQNLPNSQPISSGHDVIHTPALISCLGFIMTMVIIISFARECKLH